MTDPKAKAKYFYRVRWRRDEWEPGWREKVRYYATELGARRFIRRLLDPRPGDPLPVRVWLQRVRRTDWVVMYEEYLEPLEPAWW